MDSFKSKRFHYAEPKIFTNKFLSRLQIAGEVENLLIESIKNQMQADTSVGFFLSGGLDSSLLVGLGSIYTGSRIKTYSIAFGETYNYSEHKYQRLVSKHFNTDHTEVVIDHQKYFNSFIFALSKSSQPFQIPNQPLIYTLALEAKKNVTVLISGEGADEVFGGYGRHRMLIRKKFVEKNKVGWIANTASLLNKKFLNYASNKTSLSLFTNLLSYATEEECINFTNFQEAAHFNNLQLNFDLNNALKYDQKTYLRGLLYRIDSMTMLASIEARVPYLDNYLVDYANSLNFNKKVDIFSTKKILYEIGKKYLPIEIIKRPKVGFPLPLSEWFKSSNGLGKIVKVLLDDRSKKRGYYNQSAIKDLIKNPLLTDNKAESALFPLLTLELWIRMYVEGDHFLEYEY